MNQERLLKLADFLRNEVPSEHFTMGFWMMDDKNGHRHERASIECGTPACAAGWATAIFKELYYSRDDDLICLTGQEYTYADFQDGKLAHLMTFFDLFTDQAEYLFGSDIPRTPTEEADAIRLLIDTDGEVPEPFDEA